jgi:hypothetical protein
MSALNILINLRNLVGEVAFNEALKEMGSNTVTTNAASTKEKKPRKTDPVKTAKRKSDMAALQAYIAMVRGEMPDGTPYKEVQAAAGVRWKALDDEEKAAWKLEHPFEETKEKEEAIELVVPQEKECVVTLQTSTVKKPEQSVTVVKEAKGRGRPKKAE